MPSPPCLPAYLRYFPPLPDPINLPPTAHVYFTNQDRLYARCRELGITLLTVAHRRSLWRHHDHLLLLDGKGGWSFRPMADVEPEASSS